MNVRAWLLDFGAGVGALVAVIVVAVVVVSIVAFVVSPFLPPVDRAPMSMRWIGGVAIIPLVVAIGRALRGRS